MDLELELRQNNICFYRFGFGTSRIVRRFHFRIGWDLFFWFLVCDGAKIFTEQPLFYPRAGVVSVEKSSEHKAESQPYSCAMGEERERSFQLHEDSERENIPKLPVVKCCQMLSNVVKCCQMLSMYVVFSGQLSLFDLVNSRHSRLQHCRTADCHRIQLCHVPGASGTPAASGVSNYVCWRFSAWNQKSQPLWRESRHLAPRFLHEFFTNSWGVSDFWQVSEFQMQVTFSPCETGPFCLESS